MIITIKTIIVAICSIGLIMCIICLYRNNETYKFLTGVAEDLCQKMLRDISNHVEPKMGYDDLPSYNSVLFSFKSFKVENFLTEEQINYIYG